MLDIRDGLKICIDRSGLKQLAIASKVGMTDQQICDIVNKRRRLDANELISICQIIGATPNEVFVASSKLDACDQMESSDRGKEAS